MVNDPLVNTTSQPAASTINPADTAWVLTSTCLVFIMIPGVGYLYGGITQKKNQLTLLISSALAVGVVSIQWFIWGYSLAFSGTGGKFIGNLDHAFLINVGNEPNNIAVTIPANVFMIFQCMFAAITPSLAFGSAAERTTMPVYLVFLFIWSTLVYDIIAYWTWSGNGWLHDYGVLDFAGGTPVHITSGFSALAYGIVVGPRRTVDFKKQRPSNISDVYLGTALLWFGWFGFNGGSEGAINSRAVNAVVISNIAASAGGLTWMAIEMIRERRVKMSLSGFCCGAIAGLVCITPASGFVRPHFAVVFGVSAGIVCCFAVKIKKLTGQKYDDACDVFACHGIGGFLGNLLTGIFAENGVVVMAGDAPINGGWMDRNFIQLAYQLLSSVVAAAWAFVVTFLILILIGFIPGMRLQLSEEEERIGGDWIELGEATYGHDIETHKEETLRELQKATPPVTSYHLFKKYFSNKRTTPIDGSTQPMPIATITNEQLEETAQ